MNGDKVRLVVLLAGGFVVWVPLSLATAQRCWERFRSHREVYDELSKLSGFAFWSDAVVGMYISGHTLDGVTTSCPNGDQLLGSG